MKRLIAPTFDYTSRDFGGLKARLQDTIGSLFPQWTDFHTANFGNMLLESFCFVGDVLNYYQDKQALESFLPTLTQRVSMQRIGSLYDYDISGASASSVDLLLTISNASAGRYLTIPYGTRFRSVSATSPQTFICCNLPLAERTTALGQNALSIRLRHAEMHSQSFTSNEAPAQEFVLSSAPFLDGSLSGSNKLPEYAEGVTPMVRGVKATNGEYRLAENNSFYGYGPNDCVFVVWVDDYDNAHVLFPDGINGKIPQGLIEFSYETGGGEEGNVEANTITSIESPLFFDDGSPAIVSCSNPLAASGGIDPMSINEAKIQAPAFLRLLSRSVSKTDFETVAQSVRGVARALMVTANEYAGIVENHGELYVVAQGARLASGRFAVGTPSSAILASVTNAVNLKPPMLTFTFDVLAAVFKDISISTQVHLDRGVDATEVATSIRANLADFFAVSLDDGTINSAIDFGTNLKSLSETAVAGEITWSDVFNVINDTPGVRKIDEGNSGLLLNNLRQSVTLTAIQFPRLSTISIYDVEGRQSL